MLIKLQQSAAALADLDEALDLEFETGNPKEVARDLVEKGQLLSDGKQFCQALRALDAALEKDPGQVLAYRVRGIVLLELKCYKEAETAFNHYLNKGGKPLAAVYLARGLTHAKQGKYQDAVHDFSQALELDWLEHRHLQGWHANAEWLRYRGWAYLIIQAPALARKDFDDALVINPRDADALNGHGLALARLGEGKNALADAELAVQLGPSDDHHLYYNAARIVALVANYPLSTTKVAAEQPKFVLIGPTKAAAEQQKFTLQSRALELLKKALTLVPAEDRAQFWKDYVATDPAFESIRQTTVFKKLAPTSK
jgi:tetratricopeptide (TPR) repeat protein